MIHLWLLDVCVSIEGIYIHIYWAHTLNRVPQKCVIKEREARKKSCQYLPPALAEEVIFSVASVCLCVCLCVCVGLLRVHYTPLQRYMSPESVCVCVCLSVCLFALPFNSREVWHAGVFIWNQIAFPLKFYFINQKVIFAFFFWDCPRGVFVAHDSFYGAHTLFKLQ